MTAILFLLYGIILVSMGIYSYAFVDKNLILSTSHLYEIIHRPLSYLAYENRSFAAVIYCVLIISFFCLYLWTLRCIENNKISKQQVVRLIVGASLILVCSFPAFSYDLFNYMTTAQVTFRWKENPWIIMPIDIPNESGLAYTRAANKVALYGPTWIGLTAIPHYLGMNNVWLTIILFKLLVTMFYFIMVWFIYRQTKNLWQVAFFALNPLVLLEIILGGHNDIVMMVLIVSSLLILEKVSTQRKIVAWILLIASVLVKGATIILVPLFFIRMKKEKVFFSAYVLLFFVFLLSPLREEMYPWYAVWLIPFAALLPRKKYAFLQEGTVVLTFALMLRYIPYIYTREYAGLNQIARTTVTIVPVAFYCLYYFLKRKKIIYGK